MVRQGLRTPDSGELTKQAIETNHAEADIAESSIFGFRSNLVSTRSHFRR